MNYKRTLLALLIAALLLSPLQVLATAGDGHTIEGTWEVTIDLDDADLPPDGNFPSSFEALETYSRGGGVMTSNDMPFVTRVGQGAWDKIGNQYFVTIKFFTFDPNGLPAGTITVTHTVVLNGPDLYTGTGRADVCGPNPTDCITVDFDSVGRRLSPQP